MKEEYEDKYDVDVGSHVIGCLSLTATFFLLIIAFIVTVLLSSCRTQKDLEQTKDSVRIEYREKIVNVPVKVYVEVPAEKKERETNDTTSTLFTSFAKSTASLIWKGQEPLLFHSLENIPQKIEKADSVPVKEATRTEYRTRRVTYTKTKYVRGEMYWWQEIFFYIGIAGFFILIVFSLIYLGKKKLQR